MKIRTRFDRSRLARRGAFTMVELLIVITIIVALMALTAGAVIKYISVQQDANTVSTLDRTQSQLGKAWSKVKEQAYKEPIPTSIAAWIQTNLGGSDSNATGRVRVIYVKLKLRQAFPMTFFEALNAPTLPGNNVCPMPSLPAYVNYLTSMGIAGTTPASYPYESSACLLMALQRGVSGAGINPSDLTTGGAAGNYVTSNGSSLPYLTDAWSRPIFFTRVPTGCPVLNPAGAQTGNNDPGDPQGYLQTPNWGTSAFGANFALVTLQTLATGNTSYRLAPMLASGGQDNWMKSGNLTFHPITFAPGYYTLSTAAFTPGTTGTGVLYSKP